MVQPATFLHPSARSVERTLAVSLLALLTTYAVGTAVGGTLPAVDTAGVVAVHLAVVVGTAFPLAVLGHAVVSAWHADGTAPSRVELAVAGVSVGTLAVGVGVSVEAVTVPLVALAVGGLLVLAGLVLARS
jgi:hypothetical protein